MRHIVLLSGFLFNILTGFPQHKVIAQDSITSITIGHAIKFNSIILNEERTIFIYLPQGSLAIKAIKGKAGSEMLLIVIDYRETTGNKWLIKQLL